jgi:xanthine dehydrogenase accessory factor
MSFVLIRGGGDLASGVALRLHQSGLPVLISELPRPLAVRRHVSFAEAIYDGSIQVEDCMAYRVDDQTDTLQIQHIVDEGAIPVLVDPYGEAIKFFQPKVMVDGRMLKRSMARQSVPVPLLIGLGPGYIAGENCDAVIETNRGISMGRVIWEGAAEPNTSCPATIADHADARVLRAPVDGIVETYANIGDRIITGQTIAQISGHFVSAPFNGILRGLIHPGLTVKRGMRIGDLDPRDDPRLCFQVSDKSLAVAEGVLEAIRSKFDLQALKSAAAIESI